MTEKIQENIPENAPETLNEQVKKAIEDILLEMAPQPEDDIDRPSDDAEFENEQKRYIRD